MNLEPGVFFGRYEIVALLGQGGMGAVYRARDSRLQRDVALKVLKPELSTDAASLHRFEREARALAALTHPNVVPIFDFGFERGVAYVVTELVEGTTLRQTMKAGPIEPGEVADIGAQIADGLAAAHVKGLVHRDVKPENVVLAEGRARILDFGIARKFRSGQQLADSGDTVELTGRAGLIGTPAYMSPEQICGRPLDGRSDLFALGTMLWEMLSGRSLFRGASSEETMDAVIHAEPDVSPATIPPELAPILRRLLAKDPEQRYGSAVEVARDLRRLAPFTPTQHASIDRRTRLRPSLRASAAGIIVTSVVATGLWIAARGPTHPDRISSMAVLPFRTVGTEPGGHLGLGVADAIIARLASSPQLTVRPTSAVGRFEGVDSDALRVGRELDVDAVVEGTLSQSGGGTRATMHVTNVRRGSVVWSDQVDLPPGRLFELEDAISGRLVEHLQLKLAPGAGSAAEVSDAVLKRYLAVSSQLPEVWQGIDQIDKLLPQLDALVEEAPGFARARAARAYVEAFRNYYAPGPGRAEVALRDAAAALELDPSLALPHVARAVIGWSAYGGWRFVDAVRELRVALKVSPGSEIPHLQLAGMLYHWGWLEEARHELAEIRRIDPLSLSAQRAGAFITWFEGHPRDALEFFRREGSTIRQRGDLTWQYVAIRLQTEDAAAVRQEVEDWVRVYPDPMSLVQLAIVRVRTGDPQIAKIEERILRADQRVGHFHHVLYALAEAHAQLGDMFGAMTYLRRAADSGFPCLPCFDTDPLLAPLRASSEYQVFRTELERQHEQARAALGVL